MSQQKDKDMVRTWVGQYGVELLLVHSLLILGLVVAVMVLFVGGEPDSRSTGSNKTDTVSTSQSQTPTTTVPMPEPIEIPLSGTGQKATEKIRLQAGLANFSMKHDGSSNFSIFLLDDMGNREELLVNEVGSFDGSKAVQIPETGNYLLDIGADGAWTVTIKQ